MANPKRKIDKTHLSIDNAESRGFLHRDYIAHCLRWTHVVKHLAQQQRYKTARILDIGCGKEIPMAKLMHSSRMEPTAYYAVDVNNLVLPEQFKNAKWKPRLAGKTDVCDLRPTDFESGVPNIISCFEVLEHVAPEHSRRMLAKIYELLEPEGIAFISTPCWDPQVGAANNHINEMTYEALGAMIEDVGFGIQGHWGTFASIKDYKDELTQAQKEVFNDLRTYYDTNYLATIMAPLVPHKSRNVIWQLEKPAHNETYGRHFKNLRDVEGQWSSSDDWRQLQP
tara:strand:+ start:4673 stop:5518 length:846 start_codon:yes stop_codon:yes gene_type:complete